MGTTGFVVPNDIVRTTGERRTLDGIEFEFQMTLMNRRLAPTVETVFMMPAEEYSYVSSRLVKEVASLGGNIDGLVPDNIAKRLYEKVRE